MHREKNYSLIKYPRIWQEYIHKYLFNLYQVKNFEKIKRYS